MIIKPTKKSAAKEIKTLGPPHNWQISNGKNHCFVITHCPWLIQFGEIKTETPATVFPPLPSTPDCRISFDFYKTHNHPTTLSSNWRATMRTLDIQIFKSRIRRFLPSKASKNEMKGTKSRSSKFYFYSDWLIFFSLSNCWDFHSDCEGNLNWASLLSKYSSSGRSSSSFSCYYNLIL